MAENQEQKDRVLSPIQRQRAHYSPEKVTSLWFTTPILRYHGGNLLDN